jgi:hypothetical protein
MTPMVSGGMGESEGFLLPPAEASGKVFCWRHQERLIHFGIEENGSNYPPFLRLLSSNLT